MRIALGYSLRATPTDASAAAKRAELQLLVSGGHLLIYLLHQSFVCGVFITRKYTRHHNKGAAFGVVAAPTLFPPSMGRGSENASVRTLSGTLMAPMRRNAQASNQLFGLPTLTQPDGDLRYRHTLLQLRQRINLIRFNCAQAVSSFSSSTMSCRTSASDNCSAA